MTAQTLLSLILVLLASCWLLGRALRRARPASDHPCAACSVKACGGSDPRCHGGKVTF